MIVKLISSLDKCFLDENIDSKVSYENGSCFKNEIFRFGCCYTSKDVCNTRKNISLSICSPIKEYITVKKVEHIPVKLPVERHTHDDNYLRTTPGLYPDLLTPVEENSRMLLTNTLESLFIEVNTNGNSQAGEYPIKLTFKDFDNGETLETVVFNLEIIDEFLPEQDLVFTQWFYCDCLMNYYNIEAFSEEHWRIIERFLATACKNGVNMLYTPVFTPALDTYIGGERQTVQLVDISLENGIYTFCFEKLDRWIDMAKRQGIKYFEMSHFFTQWGAEFAPKIVANVDGIEKKIFGWENSATSREYSEFLTVFIPQLIDFLKSKGVDKQTVYHISDEPSEKHLENYKKARAIVEPLLKDYITMDALSNYEFYSEGIVKNPVPIIDQVESFIEKGISNPWCYYCMGPGANNMSNRLISMPSYRNRIIGMQFYKFGIKGFLHWGYNFYNDQLSYKSINPFLFTDGECFSPAGDCFSVYPAPDGNAWESIRICVFHDAIQDMRALQLCEKLYGKDYTLKLLEENIEPLTFSNYPKSSEFILNVREKVNRAIKTKISLKTK